MSASCVLGPGAGCATKRIRPHIVLAMSRVRLDVKRNDVILHECVAQNRRKRVGAFAVGERASHLRRRWRALSRGVLPVHGGDSVDGVSDCTERGGSPGLLPVAASVYPRKAMVLTAPAVAEVFTLALTETATLHRRSSSAE